MQTWFRRMPWRAIAIGVMVGGLYSLIDEALDNGMNASASLRIIHEIIDVVMPIGIGVLVAVAVHGLRLRSQLIAVQTERANDLERRIDRVDRNQAVWLVAAATLHRIVNPLHTLGLICEELTERDPLFADRVRVQAEKMSTALSTLRQMNVQAPQSGPLELGDYIATFAAQMAPLGERHRVHVQAHVSKELRVRADRAYLGVILENLVHNGIEALPQGGELTLSIDREEFRGVIAVRDSGGGVPMDKREALFEPLRGSTKVNGLGMGLSVSRALARSMGGDLQYVCGAGGSRFALSLPLFEVT
jgi:signal transduction histidine kinase